MKLLSYNVRGFGSNVKRKAVRSLVRKEGINFACFQETKIEYIDQDICLSIWGQGNFDWVYKASVGKSGGLLCVWDNDVFVKDTVVEIPGALAIYGMWGVKKQKCCIVNVYASCNRNERVETWTELQKMIEEGEGFWCIAGDFNSVRSEEERRGRSEHSHYREDLNDFIESAELNDLPLTRRKFTWYKSDGSAMSRLDRFLLSDDLLNFWGECCQIGLNRSISDHCPVILKKVDSDWGPKPFRVLNCWDQHPDFIETVENIWKTTEVRGWKGYVCKEKFKHLRYNLKKWNTEVFGNFEHQIIEAEAKIREVDDKNEHTGVTEEDILSRREGFSELWAAWHRREVAWKQKSKLDWVQQGDVNSKLFHRIASGNRARKLIRGIYKNGSWMEEPSGVRQEVREYFKNIFQEDQWDRPKLDGLQFKQLDDEDRIWLERDISAEEVKQAVWECGGDKSPGPDGFNFHFIRSIWRVVEKDVVDFVQEFSNNGKLVRGLNSSFIVLVPKKGNPVDLKDYRPISLINSLYKIISKVLANRIKKVLVKVISGTQSAFLGGRQITDGILILNEVVEEIKKKKVSSFIFKADFEKAYDCVNWSFLDEMMWRLGFGEKWREWIKECLQTASVSVLVNGSPTEEFKMERGIRQGDPIAPFLFLIVAEGLHGLIESAKSKDLLQGVDIGSFGLNISHLQFADDTVIMGKADPGNVKAVKGILRWFELVSGLKINFNKSVLYSFNVSDEWGRMAAASLNCKSGSTPFTYLGMPIGNAMVRRKAWVPVIENFNKKLAVWKAKCLSIGGRVTLLRSVLSALPIYFMSVFKIPKIVLHELVCIQRNFLWGHKEGKSRLAWLSWDKVCRRRKEGGLGVPDLECRNIALLGKWWDRFGKEENCLWKKVISDKYYGGGIVWDIKHTQTRIVSTLWRNILNLGNEGRRGFEIFKDGFCWKVGLGDKVKFWFEKWIGTEPLCVTYPRLFNLAFNRNASVMDVSQLTNGFWIWRNAWRREPFGRERNEEQKLKESLMGGLVLSTQPDQRSWCLDTANGFTVSKAYSMLVGQNIILETRICKRLWSRFVPAKISCFGWRLLLNGLPTKAGLLRRGIKIEEAESLCCICRRDLEDENHLFARCSKIQSLWMRCYKWWGLSQPLPNSIALLCEAHSVGIKKVVKPDIWFLIFLVVTWAIWYMRNSIIHREQQWEEGRTFDLIQRMTFVWIRGKSTNTKFPFFHWCNYPSSCDQEITRS
ncbi:hypothetical protein SLA2020_038370 [Shorea laevis]